MTREILLLADALAREKNVSKEIVFAFLELALAQAMRKKMNLEADIRVVIDRETGEHESFRRWEVVEDADLENEDAQLAISEARKDHADIAVGDGQPLGIPLSFGGPYFGYLTTTTPLVRKMPGRIVGMTKDVDGKRAFVLTLQAREQHIRREKANSNICSNQSLMALFATIYVAALGKQGMIDVNTRCIQATHDLYDRLIKTGAFHPAFDAPFAHEAVLLSSLDLNKLNDRLLKKGMLGGLPVKLPDSKKTGWLFSVSERRTPAQIDTLVQEVEMMAHEVL